MKSRFSLIPGLEYGLEGGMDPFVEGRILAMYRTHPLKLINLRLDAHARRGLPMQFSRDSFLSSVKKDLLKKDKR